MRIARSIAGLVLVITVSALLPSALANAGKFSIGYGPSLPFDARGNVRAVIEESVSTCRDVHFVGDIAAISAETVGAQTGRLVFGRVADCENGVTVTFSLPLNWRMLFQEVAEDERGKVLWVGVEIPNTAYLIRATVHGRMIECRYESEHLSYALIRFENRTIDLGLWGSPTVGLGATQLEDCPNGVGIVGDLLMEQGLVAQH